MSGSYSKVAYSTTFVAMVALLAFKNSMDRILRATLMGIHAFAVSERRNSLAAVDFRGLMATGTNQYHLLSRLRNNK
jgi:hypothetical protein